MNEQETVRYFNIIDAEIDLFNANKGFQIRKDAPSDWLVFDWRQITWLINDIEYLIEIYPHFSEQEEIISWSFYAAAWFDENEFRYSKTEYFASEVALEYIASNISHLLEESFKYITNLKRYDIPKAVKLS